MPTDFFLDRLDHAFFLGDGLVSTASCLVRPSPQPSPLLSTSGRTRPNHVGCRRPAATDSERTRIAGIRRRSTRPAHAPPRRLPCRANRTAPRYAHPTTLPGTPLWFAASMCGRSPSRIAARAGRNALTCIVLAITIATAEER
ncbi:hypothetical protein ACFQS1_01720 [Paractinoplanes rhizophilus]|jgi:hypothetical protein|uniref:Uncharacterized protein n=1 Tax=Paractinoplanes rhizophilus TaxID=1416877 RepID=A0ABW2HLH2_9ACTN|nr:hypothetical protein [Actinoplanes sp.]